MKTIIRKEMLIPVFGLSAGIINGLVGAGGGILCVFALSYLLKEKITDRRDVFANAIAIMLPLSAVSSLLYTLRGSMNVEGFAPYILPALIGGTVGALLLGRLKTAVVQKMFAILVLVSGISMILR